MSNLLPGYMTLPTRSRAGLRRIHRGARAEAAAPNQMSYWQNYAKFSCQPMKAWWGDAATAENHWGYDYLPKLDKLYDMLQMFELMNQGKMNGYICQGFNPLAAAPNKAKMTAALVQAQIPRHHGSARHRNLASSGATTASTTTSIRGRSRPKCFACRRPASPRKTAR